MPAISFDEPRVLDRPLRGRADRWFAYCEDPPAQSGIGDTTCDFFGMVRSLEPIEVATGEGQRFDPIRHGPSVRVTLDPRGNDVACPARKAMRPSSQRVVFDVPAGEHLPLVPGDEVCGRTRFGTHDYGSSLVTGDAIVRRSTGELLLAFGDPMPREADPVVEVRFRIGDAIDRTPSSEGTIYVTNELWARSERGREQRASSAEGARIDGYRVRGSAYRHEGPLAPWLAGNRSGFGFAIVLERP